MTTRSKYNLLVLILFHLIGLILFIVDPNASKLSYLTLLISGIALIIDEQMTLTKWLKLVGIFIAGYLIELVGTKTGLLFGNYQYGSALGYTFLGVPLIIGLNWVITVAASSSIAKSFSLSSLMLQALISALLCTVLDFVMEPVTIKYGFWNWEDDTVPIYNYICWFGFSYLFSLIYLYKKSNN